MQAYPLGKLPADDLKTLLARTPLTDPRVLLGGKLGEDAAVIEMGDRYLVAKTDPITFATAEIGWYAVNVSANDVAAMGAIPRWFLATLLLPENNTTPALVENIFSQITQACTALNVSLVGGHTEITYDLHRPLVVGQMLGEAAIQQLCATSSAQPGDDIVLTKQIAIEGTAIIAAEKRPDLSDYAPELLDKLANYLHEPGISVVPEANIARKNAGVHAMHDPTEGGLATGLWEIASAAQVGLRIFADALPFDDYCLDLCRRFELDPLGLIASGSLLITVDPSASPHLLEALAQANIPASRIGRVEPKFHGVKLYQNAAATQPSGSLPHFPRDEITRLFGD